MIIAPQAIVNEGAVVIEKFDATVADLAVERGFRLEDLVVDA